MNSRPDRTVQAFPALVFDLDGTLLDSVPDIGQALNRTLTDLGRPTVSAAQVRRFVGDGVRRLVERGLEATGGLPDAAAQDAALDRFMAIYGAIPADPACIFPGVLDTLRALAAAGHSLAVCTNKPEAITRELLRDLGLLELLAAVVGGDTLPQRKPAPEPLLAAIAGMGAVPAGALMVGDSENDVATARAAGVPVVAVSYGYSRVPLADLGADHMIDRFEELPGALAILASRRV